MYGCTVRSDIRINQGYYITVTYIYDIILYWLDWQEQCLIYIRYVNGETVDYSYSFNGTYNVHFVELNRRQPWQNILQQLASFPSTITLPAAGFILVFFNPDLPASTKHLACLAVQLRLVCKQMLYPIFQHTLLLIHTGTRSMLLCILVITLWGQLKLYL